MLYFYPKKGPRSRKCLIFTQKKALGTENALICATSHRGDTLGAENALFLPKKGPSEPKMLHFYLKKGPRSTTEGGSTEGAPGEHRENTGRTPSEPKMPYFYKETE